VIAPSQVHAAPIRDGPTTWVDLLRDRTQQRPDLRVCTFLVDGEAKEVSLTYAELETRARAIAAELQSRHGRGDRALLLYPPGLEYIAAFLGCLYAGLVAVPVYPPHPARLELTLPKLRSVAGDVRPQVVLTTTAGFSLAGSLADKLPALCSLPWLATDDLCGELAGQWRDPRVTADTVALIQYTSGSTAAPRGVMLTHANTLHNSAVIQAALGNSAHSIGVIWLPPYHDMGLVGGILQPLYLGSPVVLMSPLHCMQRPLRWLTAISRYRATVTAGPNFAYDLCVSRTQPEQRMALDLRSMESAVVGAEPINAGTLERFIAAFAPCGFRRGALRPAYGLAESTLMVAASQRPSTVLGKTSRALVSCGRPGPDQTIVIVDPESGLPCVPGTTGEVWVSGPSVAAGYWNRPAETEAKFHARLMNTPEGPFLRSGDLGFVHEGDLFITGRLTDLIIVRGRKHHAADIEWTVAGCHPALAAAVGAAISISVDGEERLVIVHETDRHRRHLDGVEITDAIRRAVIEEHDLLVASAVLVTTGSIPRTSSGKVQRFACRERYLIGTLDVLYRWG